uniref:Transglycosylase SLT domain-containing protein n=1 Tax=uncultured Nocardioidaceae bacterium TaxID=253824 RepID=A0A6J4KTE3_9ACTN|nr:MAG: hypothetical protein AVDCRST_MAG46-272 [uncultured Nocardioidaceae bacterium]
MQRARSRVGHGVRTLSRPVAVAAMSGALLAASAVADGAVVEREAGSALAPVASTPTVTTDAGDREPTTVSRASDRPSLAEPKADVLANEATRPGRQAATARVQREEPVAESDPRDIARAMLPQYGWSDTEFSCLDALWVSESDWEWNADNPTSSAYGIPQALPGEKMASAGPDWETNPATQIEWGLGYIRDVYGTPCAANSFKVANNWY